MTPFSTWSLLFKNGEEISFGNFLLLFNGFCFSTWVRIQVSTIQTLCKLISSEVQKILAFFARIESFCGCQATHNLHTCVTSLALLFNAHLKSFHRFQDNCYFWFLGSWKKKKRCYFEFKLTFLVNVRLTICSFVCLFFRFPHSRARNWDGTTFIFSKFVGRYKYESVVKCHMVCNVRWSIYGN